MSAMLGRYAHFDERAGETELISEEKLRTVSTHRRLASLRTLKTRQSSGRKCLTLPRHEQLDDKGSELPMEIVRERQRSQQRDH